MKVSYNRLNVDHDVTLGRQTLGGRKKMNLDMIQMGPNTCMNSLERNRLCNTLCELSHFC